VSHDTNLKERDHTENLDVGGRIGTRCGLFEHGFEFSGSVKCKKLIA
jgi:hypothetical protein